MALTIAWITVLVILVTSTGLLIVRDWRWSIFLLAVQYLGVFVLTLQHWPLGMASVKLVAGWMSGAILGMTRSGFPSKKSMNRESGRVDVSSACSQRGLFC